MKITFLGANRQVTGSRYCLETDSSRIMIDCGLVQERQYLARNWEACPIPAESIDALLLTHVHIDHCGLIPRFVANGFNARILATRPSVALAEVMLRDSARIQTEDAAYKARRHRKEGRRGKFPDEPLYGEKAVEDTLPLFQSVPYGTPQRINDAFTVTFHEAGHILGSAILELQVTENEKTRTVLFSGDLGQWDKPLIRDPVLLEHADYVVMESTYGDRDHKDGGDIETQLRDIINETVAAGGNVVIPTFAVERSQELMYHISRLVHDNRIPDIPIYLDSPMAVDVTNIFLKFRDCFDDETWRLIDSDEPPLRFPGLTFARTVEQSKAINASHMPSVIMATSGMCTAGRIKHHLRRNIRNPHSTILFVGFQGRGTLGRQILEGKTEVRIHGKSHPVRAKVAQIFGFSGHADRTALLRWLTHLKQPPRHVFLTHGDEEVALQLADHIDKQIGWSVSVPQYKEAADLR